MRDRDMESGSLSPRTSRHDRERDRDRDRDRDRERHDSEEMDTPMIKHRSKKPKRINLCRRAVCLITLTFCFISVIYGLRMFKRHTQQQALLYAQQSVITESVDDTQQIPDPASSQTTSNEVVPEISNVDREAFEKMPKPTLFGRSTAFVIITSPSHHQYVLRMMQLWGKYIKTMYIFTHVENRDFTNMALSKTERASLEAEAQREKDDIAKMVKEYGFIEIKTPHPTWEIADLRYASWRYAKALSHINDFNLRAEQYILMDDTSFPLLDKIKDSLMKYADKYPQERYPMFATGKQKLMHHPQTVWTQQHQYLDRFPTSMNYSHISIYSFARGFLTWVQPNLDSGKCPVLFPNELAVHGMMACAGGYPPNTAWDFYQSSSRSPHALSYNIGTSLNQWQQYHTYQHVDTIQQLEDAFYWYYSKIPQTSTNPT